MLIKPYNVIVAATVQNERSLIMEIRVSENIKRLRKEKGLTQETLAGILHISPQSISKWERGDAYPDISMLPTLANCFGITIDALLGNDQIIAEERIKHYIEEYKKFTTNEEGQRALELAKIAYEDYSYDYRIVMLYVNALKVYGTSNDKEEIECLCKLVLKNCTDKTLLLDASSHILGLNSAEDKFAFMEKYIEYGQDWNWFNVYPHSSVEGKIMMQSDIIDKWWHLNAYIGILANSKNDIEGYVVSPQEKIALIKKQQAIFNAMFDEDDFGEFVFYVGQFNELLTKEYLAIGDTEKAIECFEKSVNGWLAYNNLPNEYEYKNILISYRPCMKEKLNGSYTTLSRYKNEIDKNPIYDIIRNREEFINAYSKL